METEILVVTNDSEMGMRLISILKSKGYTSEICDDLREIFSIASNHSPRLIFWLFHSDMPEDIPDVMLQIQQTGDSRPLNFVAYPRDLFDPRFEYLADAFVVSPFHVGDALDTIEDLLTKK